MPSGGQNRVSEDVRRRRGTYRPDRSDRAYGDAGMPESEENKAWSIYVDHGRETFIKASRGEDVKADIAFLRQAENALRQAGFITQDNCFSALADIASAVYSDSFPRPVTRVKRNSATGKSQPAKTKQT